MEAKLDEFVRGGGVVTFWGIVRHVEDGKPIRALEYTAYHEMRAPVPRTARTDAPKWKLKRIRVIHRLGPSPLANHRCWSGEAAHRGEAFAAAQFIIDELKQKVPIWKKAVP